MLASMFRSTDMLLDSSMDIHEKKPQYNVFEDYLGLINLVCPSRCSSSLGARSCESLTSCSLYDFPQERHRINSLDSDGLSDSASSSGSRELDVIYDSISLNSDLLAYSQPTPSPPLSAGLQEATSYNSTLESLLACQNSARLHSLSKDNRNSKNKATVCVFCRNNGESREFYSTHTLKDNAGKTTCPILRAYTCPLCKANGDNSHTVKYCPKYTPKVKDEKLLSIGLL